MAALGGLQPGYNLVFDGVAGAGMILLSLVALRWIRRSRLVAAGYLLAAGYFVLVSAILIAFPHSLFLYATGFFLPILIAGGIVGGLSVYPFAAGAILFLIYAWLRSRSLPLAEAGLLETSSGVTFLIGQSVLLVGASLLLHTLSDHLLQTLSMLRNQAERLTELAHTDSLTGLANRRHLIEKLEREFTRARRYQRPLSLLYLDLDGFKAINDQFGHMFGDEILRAVAMSLRSVLRSTDVLARFGGDEFAILLPETTLEGSQNVAEKLRKALASYGRQLGPMVPPLTFCAGASQLLESDTTVDDILSRADQAQYLAKDTGKAHTRTQRELPQPAAVE
jgi:diguanylate cyclase (GGDEF)-like protein